MPLILGGKISARTAEAVLLPSFRAAAIARVALISSKRGIQGAAAAASNAAFTAVMDVAYSADHFDHMDLVGVARDASDAVSAQDAKTAADRVSRSIADAVRADVVNIATIKTALKEDTSKLGDSHWTPRRLARFELWSGVENSDEIKIAWSRMSAQLRGLGDHWRVWIDWYDEVSAGSPPTPQRSEAWEMAFTDVETALPWNDLAHAVNGEIAARLRRAREAGPVSEKLPEKERILAELADIASPQPSLTDDGRLDAGANLIYDRPSVDDDLSTLPIRQRQLTSVILSDLPKNAPAHVASCLRGYGDELKARGVQPILGLLKDMADIIAAAVAAPRADDEWLEAGMRQAFDRFAENHSLFMEHFPLDPRREEVFAQIRINEESTVGNKLTAPFENVAKASRDAHRAGLTTDGYALVMDKTIELVRILAHQPPPQPGAPKHGTTPSEILIDPTERPERVSVKRRFILSALGFFERSFNIAGSSASIAASEQGARVLEALKSAIESLWNFVS